jgi:hypothetical protein
MLDKIRIHSEGRLPADYNRGTGFDGRTCRFLQVDYEKLVSRVLRGGTDEEILEWSYQQGRRPSEEEILVWNAFMTKRGWRDDASEWLVEQKRLRDSHIATISRRHLIFTGPMKRSLKSRNPELFGYR